jgi:hypothetical protein
MPRGCRRPGSGKDSVFIRVDDFRLPFLANAAIAAVAAGALALLFVANSDPPDGAPFRYNFLAAWPQFSFPCYLSLFPLLPVLVCVRFNLIEQG